MKKQVKIETEKLRALGLDKSGFKTPANYFEEFSDDLFAKIQEENLPKESGFKAPEFYFDELEEAVLSKIEFPKQKKRTTIRVLYTISSIAAAALLYIGVSQYQYSETINFDSLTTNDVENWILSGEMSSYDIASVGNEEIWSTLEINEISNEEINNYLDTVEPEYLFLEN